MSVEVKALTVNDAGVGTSNSIILYEEKQVSIGADSIAIIPNRLYEFDLTGYTHYLYSINSDDGYGGAGGTAYNLLHFSNSKNKLPLELVDLINIKQYFTKRHNSYKDGEFLLRIELEDDLFWNPEHIKQLTHYHHFNSEAGYCSDLISYNDSVRWNYDLFVFIRDYGLYWDEQFKPLTEREKFFDFLMDDYGKKELLDFFRGIYNPNRFYTLENKFTQL